MRPPVARVSRVVWRAGGATDGERAIPEEAAVSFTYNGGSYAVMMATPRDLEDFAYGFSLSEGIVANADEIQSLDIVDQGEGIELRMWLAEPRAARLSERRRYLAGPTGCGLCGIDSLTEAMRTPAQVADGLNFTQADVMQALESLSPLQELNHQTRAVHAAAFWTHDAGLMALREDVGRHNALDKLGGALARAGIPGASGMVVVTSRVSIEMVQKAAAMGVPVIVAISAPTALAVRTAQAAGMTLIAVARSDGFEVFTHPQRIRRSSVANVA